MASQATIMSQKTKGHLSVENIIADICIITNDCTKVQNPQHMCGFPKWLQTKELADRQ